MKHFWIVGQLVGSQVTEASSELLGSLHELAVDQLAEVAVVLVGSDLRMRAPTLGRMGQPMTILIESENLKNRDTEIVGREVADLAAKRKPELIITPHNQWGLEVAAKISARTRNPLVTDVQSISAKDDGFVVEKYVFGGQILSKVWTPSSSVLTVHPGVFDTPRSADITTTVEMLEPATMASEIKKALDHIEPSDEDGPSIADSKIIVSCGRGLQKKENLVLGKQLARKLGAALGASRTIVDAEWIHSSHQVGLTGKVVSPRLYVHVV
ncbi:MAG: electron transfer flavoprotein subunit alpha/FixB family protein [Caldisericia bacterium]